MPSLGDALQCSSLGLFLEPIGNVTAMNSTSANVLRVNTCTEHGIVQPVMAFLLLILAAEVLVAGCKRKELPKRKFLCFSFLAPVLTSTLIALASIGILLMDWAQLPQPGKYSPSFYGNNSVHDGTTGTMYLFVGDTSEVVSGLLLTYITSKVILTTGKTPMATSAWVLIQAIFVSVGARLPAKSIIAQNGDPSSALVAQIIADARWESLIEIEKEQNLESILRLTRAVLYVVLTMVLLCRRETPQTKFDPRKHMPKAYLQEKGKLGAGQSPNTPDAGAWALGSPTDESTVPDEERYSNEYGGSIVTRLMFSWIDPILSAGWKSALEMKQLFLLGGEDDAVVNARRVQEQLDKIGLQNKNSLIKSVVRVYYKEILGSGLFMLLSIAATLAQPQALYQLLDFIQQDTVETSMPYWWGYLWAAVGAVCLLLQQLFVQQAYWILIRLGFRLRGAMTVLLFEKSLRLNQPEMSSIGIGKIVNLAEVDCMKLMWSVFVIHSVWSLPLTLLVGLAQLYMFISWGALSGIGVMALLFVPNVIFMKKAIGLIGFVYSLRDRRVKLLTEHIGSIRLIKMLGWEREKLAEVAVRRTEENDNRWWLRLWFTCVGTIATSTPALINIATFCIFIAISAPAPLTAATGFTVLSLTGIIQGPASGLGRVLQLIANINISLQRLEKFLNADETTVLPLQVADAADESMFEDAPTKTEVGYYWSKEPLTTDSSLSAKRTVLRVRNAAFQWAAGEEKDKALLEKGRKAAGKGKRKRTSKKSSVCCGSRKKKNDLSEPLLDVAAGTDDAADADEAAETDSTPSEPAPPAGPTISDIDITVKEGDLVMIVGKVGSGKSTLLSAMVNEVPFVHGQVALRGARAYCSQVAWIQNLSVKENILMGAPFEKSRYDDAVRGSCLAADLASLPAGDETEIGERGISLSGGQKKRVAIARAIYAGADVYFLDDILSAVDAHVADHIMAEGICGALKGKTRILVTHAIHLLGQADYVIVMDKGKIVEQGTLGEIRARGTDLSQYIEIEDEKPESKTEDGDETASAGSGGKSPATTADKPATQAPKKEVNKKNSKITEKEERKYGAIACKVWIRFFSNLGISWSVLMVLAMIIGLGFDQVLSWWVTYWTDAATVSNATASNASSAGNVTSISPEDTQPVFTQGFYLAIFAAMNVISVAMITWRSCLRIPAGYQLSQRIHRDALWGVLRAPVSYFDTTKIGRIINKFASDLAVVDSELVNNVMQFINSILSALLATIVVALVCPMVLLVMIPVLGGFFVIQRKYRASIRELQRLVSVSRSPVFSAFSEALDGASTIRCFHKEDYFAYLNEKRLRTNLSCAMNKRAANKWCVLLVESAVHVVFVIMRFDPASVLGCQ